ncbi:MAG: hypothetical protein JRH17_22985 [Deltaproteobacteria bacterium]|nr:hypothetical protein [Deltaproteobacteria bacterium]
MRGDRLSRGRVQIRGVCRVDDLHHLGHTCGAVLDGVEDLLFALEAVRDVLAQLRATVLDQRTVGREELVGLAAEQQAE